MREIVMETAISVMYFVKYYLLIVQF